MTTGATGQLGLALPVQGELSGTWGDTVNNGITQYTNIAIAGTLTLTGDGAVTLANTTGDASASNITSSLTGAGTVTAQFAIVKVTGTLTTAKVVTGPSYSKTYTVVNSATGGIVTFKASGQTGVSIAVGETAFVYFNGIDYVKVVGTATAGAAGGSNTQVQFNSSGVLAGSSSLTWDGTTLSSTQVNITGQGTLRLQDTTGGEYVGLRSPGTLSASYTLTFPADDGTSGQALITDGSGVLSWSSAASGDVYGPASATNNALARFDGTTGKLLKDSSALIFDGSNLGVTASSSAGFVGLTTQNTSAGAGASSGLGINNDSTASTYLRTYGSGQTNSLFGSVIANYTAILSDGVASNGILFGTLTNKPIIFGQNNAESMRLTSTGLGIGTSSPAYKLDVVGATGTTTSGIYETSASGSSIAISRLRTTGTGLGYWDIRTGNTASGLTGALDFFDNIAGASRVTFSNAGNVGIGTSSPGTPLDVAASSGTIRLTSTTGTNFTDIRVVNTGGTLYSGIERSTGGVLGPTGAYEAFFLYGADRPMYIGTGNSYLRFGTNATERMRLDSSGNLGLGVTPSAWSAKAFELVGGSLWSFTNGYVQLIQNGYYNGTNYIYKNTAQASNYQQFAGQHQWNVAPSGTAGNAITFTQAMTLTADGKLGIGITSPSEALHVVAAGGYNATFSENSSNKVRFQIYVDANETALVGLYNTTAKPMTFYTGSAERMRITAGGNVLIGTNSDQNRRLQVSGQFALVDAALNSIGDMSIDSSGNMYISPYNGSGSTIVFSTAPSGSGTTERARINSTGQLIVGATNAGSNLAGIQNGNGWVERDFYNAGGSTCTIVIAGDYNYIFEITACAIGNNTNSQVDEGRWIAGRRDYSGANHIYNSASIVGTGISFSTSQSIVGTRCTYTLAITNTQDTANNHWMIKVRLYNNSTTLSIAFA